MLSSDPLDEPSLRRPDFDGTGYWVELADGARYCLPAVRLIVFPFEDRDGKDEIGVRPWYAGAMERELDILYGVALDDEMGLTEARMRIAAHLLRANYDLPKGAISRLLRYQPGDPASEAWWAKVQEACLGRDPEQASDQDAPDPNAGTPPGSA